MCYYERINKSSSIRIITNFLSQRFAAENIYRADKAIVIHPVQYLVKISKNVWSTVNCFWECLVAILEQITIHTSQGASRRNYQFNRLFAIPERFPKVSAQEVIKQLIILFLISHFNSFHQFSAADTPCFSYGDEQRLLSFLRNQITLAALQ